MKSFLSFISMIILAALISSCQKEASQVPAAKTPATAMQINSLAVVPTSGLAYTVNLGMIDYYPFHGNANDGSGHGHNGLLFDFGYPPDYGGDGPLPSLATNKYGKANEAYLFDGQSNEIFVDNVFDATKPVPQFSFYVRYKANSTGNLLSSGDGNAYFTPFFTLQASADNTVDFFWHDYFTYDDQQGVSIHTKAAPRCSWNDVVVNFSNNIVTIYLNGTMVGSASTTFPSFGHFDRFLAIGAQYIRYPGNTFNSAIDEVRIYNRPLTTDEISYLYAH